MTRDPDQGDNANKLRLATVLISLFLFALLMGPGPGMYLINNYAAEGGRILGLPALYAWVVFWFLIEASIILTAYFKLWGDDEK